MQDNGHVMLALFLAWKGSSFNWHVEAAPTYLTNLHWLLTFLHTLRVAVAVPSKLVLAVFDFLSCPICVAGLASRSIFVVELVAPLLFVHKRLASRCDVHAIQITALTSMRLGLPKGDFVGRVRIMRDGSWAQQVDEWAKLQNPLVTAIYEHAETYSTMWPFFMKHCLSSAIAACQRHMQPDDFADETMVHNYVSTNTIESAFGKLNQTN